jgi:hypothetical protein
MFALAREMGAEPKLQEWLFKAPRVFAAAAFGQVGCGHARSGRLLGVGSLVNRQNRLVEELQKKHAYR